CCSCVFFFSSRRRHTRFSRDWSSDVCSSDLTNCHVSSSARTWTQSTPSTDTQGSVVGAGSGTPQRTMTLAGSPHAVVPCDEVVRSEERRVGKERRWRRVPYEHKDKRAGRLRQ